VHRTGHNIGAHADHGDSANLDDLETHDTRALVPDYVSIERHLPAGVQMRPRSTRVLEPDGPKVYTPVRAFVRIPA
jgi:hypothetical protein